MKSLVPITVTVDLYKLLSVSVSVLYSTETPFGYYVEGGVGETLAARFPQPGFEGFQAGTVPSFVGEAIPVSYSLWVVTVLVSCMVIR